MVGRAAHSRPERYLDDDMALKDNEAYYDEFADWYERERHDGYHALIDELESDLVVPLARDREVLEIGCGTGLILRRVAPVARRAVGLDLSEGMLRRARERGLEAIKGTATELPFGEGEFDLVYSFKVLSHVRDLDRALREAARVTRPGGELMLEFYNPLSLRYLAKRLRSGRISPETTEGAVYTRFDSLRSLRRRLPPELAVRDVRGVRVFTPHAALHKVPGVRDVLARLERLGRDGPLRYFGGFLVLHLERQ
jgi:ubiquinone/menaquinone biosynthesis C-methylase UbiE